MEQTKGATTKKLVFRVGDIEFRNRCMLAPMSGVTDVPFRRLAWEFGAGMVVSEMVASEALLTGQAEMQLKAESGGLPVHMVQIAGREGHWMAEAARLAEANGAAIVDINMGCPSKRVTNGYSGSALMRDLDHARGLIEAVVKAVGVPVTLKMRLGWDGNSINAPELARIAEGEGVRMLTVHGRTRNQFYKPSADWNKVRAVRDSTSLPLVVNGDIASADDARAAMEASGADAVMVGRAAYGAPWLSGMIGAAMDGEPPVSMPVGEGLRRLVMRHHGMMVDHYGRELGMRNARKHLDWYMRHLPEECLDPQERQALMQTLDPAAAQALIASIFAPERSIRAAA